MNKLRSVWSVYFNGQETHTTCILCNCFCVQGILQRTQTKKSKVICYVLCTKQTKTRGVKVKDLCTIPLKSIDMMFLTSAPG
jgi:hypothetical protein